MNMIQEKVTIIIPTFRGEATICRAVKSALSQDYDLCEVIVVDDNDPSSVHRHNTEKKLRPFLEENTIQLVKHDRNMNGSKARNTGVSKATGEYIAFLDDDDEYLPNRISVVLSKAKETGADLVFSDVLVKKNGQPIRLVKACERQDWFLETLLNENIIGTGSNIFVRKSAYDDCNGFDEKLIRNQDVDFLLNLFSRNKTAASVGKVLVIKNESDELHVPTHGELRTVKQYLLSKYKSDISVYSESILEKINENVHKSLLKTAIQNDDLKGIETERKTLLNRLSVKERVDLEIAMHPKLLFLRKMYDGFRKMKLVVCYSRFF